MPKERTHWHLAARAGAVITPGPLADAVLAYPELLLLGAVSHDTAYYALGNDFAKSVADKLHGTGGHDSFEPFRALAVQRDQWGAPGLVFGLGALTHLVADAVFHPLVFSWTGDAGAPDPDLRKGWFFRHQEMETALDLHLEALWGPAPAKTYASLAVRAREDLAVVEGFLGPGARPWMAAHARLQGLFHHGWVRSVAQFAAWGHRRGDGDWSGAFYGRPGEHPLLQGTLEWVDPVTGRASKESVGELVDRFDRTIAVLAADWEASWVSGRVPFEGRVGPALDTAVPCDQPQAKEHFSARWPRTGHGPR